MCVVRKERSTNFISRTHCTKVVALRIVGENVVLHKTKPLNPSTGTSGIRQRDFGIKTTSQRDGKQHEGPPILDAPAPPNPNTIPRGMRLTQDAFCPADRPSTRPHPFLCHLSSLPSPQFLSTVLSTDTPPPS